MVHEVTKVKKVVQERCHGKAALVALCMLDMPSCVLLDMPSKRKFADVRHS